MQAPFLSLIIIRGFQSYSAFLCIIALRAVQNTHIEKQNQTIKYIII